MSTQPPTTWWTKLSWLVLATIGAMVGAHQWWATKRGFDLTDEGMYLSWLDAPHDWPWASTQFAFLFGPLWAATGGDLAMTRRIAVLLVSAVAACFIAVVVRRTRGTSIRESLLWGAALSPISLLGIGSPALFAVPNYNLVGLIGIMLAGTALVGVLLARPETHSWWPWALLGIAGVVCFASRPTAGALLLAIVLIALPTAGRWSWPGLAVSGATALAALLAMAIAIDGNPLRFIDRVVEGINLYSIQTRRTALDALSNTWTHVTAWDAGDQRAALLLGVALFVLLTATSLLRRYAMMAPLVLVALIGVGVAVFYFFLFESAPLSARHTRMVTIAAALTTAALLAVWWRGDERPGRQALVTAGALVLLPGAYAFATYNSTVSLLGTVAVLWFAASLVLVGRFTNAATAHAALGGVWLLATALCVLTSSNYPPRQASLFVQDTPIVVGAVGEVKVSADMASYLTTLKDGARGAGFTPRTPLLDLTGESPGVVHHLEAKATADSWVIGGYVGSADRLLRELRVHTDCTTIGTSWLLVTTDGARRISPDVLTRVGLRFPADYVRVTEAKAPSTSLGYTAELWKPQDETANLSACSATR